MAVTGQVPEKKKTSWVIEEQYERIEGIQVGYYDSEYQLHRQVLRSGDQEMQVDFSSPMSVRHLTLPPGEEKSNEYKQIITDTKNKTQVGTAKITVQTKRVHDERLITPVGAYLCRHFISRIGIQSTVEGETFNFSATEEMYWSDMLAWFVKESLTFDLLLKGSETIRPAYKTESVLVGIE